MNFRTLNYVAAAALAFASPGRAQEAQILTPEYLDGLRAAVRAEHPSLAAARAKLRAADAAVRGVRLWEDPMAGVAFTAAEADMRRDEGDLMFSFEQTLPRKKLYEAERSKMKAERSMTAADLEATALKLETLAAQTVIELALADEMIAIDTSQLLWAERMAANARERLKNPDGTASEALRMESELAQEKQKLTSNRLMRQRLVKQLNILLGKPADTPWTSFKLPPNPLEAPALENALAQVAAHNPMLHALGSAAEASGADAEIAERESKPMFSVGVDSKIYSGGDFREAAIGAKMTIPLFNRSIYRARVDRANENREAALKQMEAVERELRSELVMAYTDAENAASQAATFAKEVIPRAEKAAESTENAWITSKANLLELLEAQRAVLNARLEERRFVAAQAAALERLRSIVPPKIQH